MQISQSVEQALENLINDYFLHPFFPYPTVMSGIPYYSWNLVYLELSTRNLLYSTNNNQIIQERVCGVIHQKSTVYLWCGRTFFRPGVLLKPNTVATQWCLCIPNLSRNVCWQCVAYHCIDSVGIEFGLWAFWLQIACVPHWFSVKTFNVITCIHVY